VKFFPKNEYDRVVCPDCIDYLHVNGKSHTEYNSTVVILADGENPVLIEETIHYDKHGDVHCHPLVNIFVSYMCSYGHTFTKPKKFGCWCGWRN
jgi:hypothetical protein